MLKISERITIPEAELEFSAIRAQGAGGQNVNKVASAVHLRFDARTSGALPPKVKERLLATPDRRISDEGVIVIKAQRFRSQPKNREDALARLADMIRAASRTRKARVPTKPSLAARQKRLDEKTRRGRLKQARGKIED